MWPGDKYWMPKMLEGEKFRARIKFNEEGDKVLSHRVREGIK